MPNRDHTPEFWRQVATAYGHNNAVIFDLFNEPFPDNNSDTPEAWRCWRDGGPFSGVAFQAPWMQVLEGAVRCSRSSDVIYVWCYRCPPGLSPWPPDQPSASRHHPARPPRQP